MILRLPRFVFVDDSSVVRRNAPNKLRSEMEIGPQKTRPIQSIPMVNYDMNISIPSKKSKDFDSWFINDLNWGTNFFFMNDPISGDEKRFRIVNDEVVFTKNGTLLKAQITIEAYHAI